MRHRSRHFRWFSLPCVLARSVGWSVGSWWSQLNRCQMPDGEWAGRRTARFAASEGAFAVWCRVNSGAGGFVMASTHRGESAGIAGGPCGGARGRP